METIETLIPDNEGNHLVVVLYFYDDEDKEDSPELYRWSLFDSLYKRYSEHLENIGIRHKDIIVGPNGFQTFARVFYRDKHASIIHFVTSHLNEKYND